MYLVFWNVLFECWMSDVEEMLVCCYVWQEIYDVKSFFFCLLQGCMFLFEFGQFIMFEFDIDGEMINCCYMILLLLVWLYMILIMVKCVLGGKVLNWLYDNLQLGVVVCVFGLVGEFMCVWYLVCKYLFLLVGLGVMLLMLMSCVYYDFVEDCDILFVYSVCMLDDIIFVCEFDLIVLNYMNFCMLFVVECVGVCINWLGVMGFLMLLLLKLIVLDFMECEIFMCGFVLYMKVVCDLFDEVGFDCKQYYEESFLFEMFVQIVSDEVFVEFVLVVDGVDVVMKQYMVSFVKSNCEIVCGLEQYVFDVVCQLGVWLLVLCMQGMCGICKVKLVLGQVEMKYNGGICQCEIDQGMVLLCCSKLLLDFVIDKQLKQVIGCLGVLCLDKFLLENNDIVDLWLKNLER